MGEVICIRTRRRLAVKPPEPVGFGYSSWEQVHHVPITWNLREIIGPFLGWLFALVVVIYFTHLVTAHKP